MNKTKAQQIGEAIKKALMPVAKDFGLQLDMRGGSFDSTSFTPKILLAETNGLGMALTPEASAFRLNAKLYGLEPEWLFTKRRKRSGERFTIIGLNTRATRQPILVQFEDGREFKTSPEMILGSLPVEG